MHAAGLDTGSVTAVPAGQEDVQVAAPAALNISESMRVQFLHFAMPVLMPEGVVELSAVPVTEQTKMGCGQLGSETHTTSSCTLQQAYNLPYLIPAGHGRQLTEALFPVTTLRNQYPKGLPIWDSDSKKRSQESTTNKHKVSLTWKCCSW
jgi:hypothetical protein